jgi:hypothetical protein
MAHHKETAMDTTKVSQANGKGGAAGAANGAARDKESAYKEAERLVLSSRSRHAPLGPDKRESTLAELIGVMFTSYEEGAGDTLARRSLISMADELQVLLMALSAEDADANMDVFARIVQRLEYRALVLAELDRRIGSAAILGEEARS